MPRQQQQPDKSITSSSVASAQSAVATTTTMTTTRRSKSVADARAKFVASVSRGISVLMEEHGYSRDRAQTVLLREIARGDITPPHDTEIFEAMSAHGLGIEGAATALTVSKALQRATTERDVNMLQAIDELTSKLSVANLTRTDRGRPPLVPASPIPPLPSEVVRIKPVHPVTLPRSSKTTTTTTTSSSSSATTAATPIPPSGGRKSKSVNKAAKQKHNGNSRKRTVEDITVTANNDKQSTDKDGSSASNIDSNSIGTSGFRSRERSDSLAEAVSAKFGEKGEESSSSSNARSTDAAVVRAKRGRDVEGEAAQSVVKRARSESQL